MSAFKFAAIAVIGLSLAACAGSPDGSGPGPRENSGTLLGAGGGALLGAAVAGGGTGNRLAGAAVGGLLGGLIGNRIGAAMDDEDKRRAYEAQMDALERGQSGAPTSWKNPMVAGSVNAPPTSNARNSPPNAWWIFFKNIRLRPIRGHLLPTIRNCVCQGGLIFREHGVSIPSQGCGVRHEH